MVETENVSFMKTGIKIGAGPFIKKTARKIAKLY